VPDLAEPAHEVRQQDARHAIGQQEVEILLLQQVVAQDFQFHHSVTYFC
jgi:hypothetical protein